jgi:hypothetical protein
MWLVKTRSQAVFALRAVTIPPCGNGFASFKSIAAVFFRFRNFFGITKGCAKYLATRAGRHGLFKPSDGLRADTLPGRRCSANPKPLKASHVRAVRRQPNANYFTTQNLNYLSLIFAS